MRHTFRTAVTILALAALPASALAQTTTAKPKPATASTTAKKSTAKEATHSTTGVVKAMDANSLVITHGGKNGKDMTFALNASTQKDGTVAVGSPVSVRYHQEGSSNIATAVALEHPKTTSTAAKTTTKK
jgi:hypothetical protein